MISGVYSESNLGNNYSGVSGGVFGNNDWGGSDANWIAPHGYDTFHKEVERKRTGLNGAFTWQIDDGFEPKLIHTIRGVGYVLSESDVGA